jgi:hypothetical protein
MQATLGCENPLNLQGLSLQSSKNLISFLLLDELLQEWPPKPIGLKWNKRKERRGDEGENEHNIFPTLHWFYPSLMDERRWRG